MQRSSPTSAVKSITLVVLRYLELSTLFVRLCIERRSRKTDYNVGKLAVKQDLYKEYKILLIVTTLLNAAYKNIKCYMLFLCTQD